mgnify:CR=1 FL=1
MEEMKIHTAGDSSVLIEFGQEISPEINAKITAFVHLMKAQHVEGKSQPQSCQDEQQHGIRPEGAQAERAFAASETACHGKGDAKVEYFFADPEQGHDGNGLFSKKHDGDQRAHRS